MGGASPLRLSAAEALRRPGTERHLSVQRTVAELDLDDPRLEPQATVTAELRLDTLTDGVVVDGHVQAPWVGTCRRCLQPASGVQHIDIHELYQPVVTDPEAFPIEGEYLDLVPMVVEAILLETPTDPLCRPECAGLCPVCGIDRNAESCACASAAADDRWSALDALRGVLPSTGPAPSAESDAG